MSSKLDRLSWTTRGRKKVQDCRIFSVYAVDRENSTGGLGQFIQLEAPNWVTVIPLVIDAEGGQRFLMVSQYRHGNEMVTREFPAGTVEMDEPPAEAAARELLEETGYQAKELIELGTVSPNPAFMSNRVTTFLARDLHLVQEQELDEHELIDVVSEPVADVISSMGTGAYDNGIMMISLLYYLRYAGRLNSQ